MSSYLEAGASRPPSDEEKKVRTMRALVESQDISAKVVRFWSKYLLGHKFMQLCLRLYETEMTGFEWRDYTSIFKGAESRRGEGIVDAREVPSMEEGVCSKWTF